MRAAAENLTPVTLELGGKSPTVVCEDFDIETAASRILYAKFLNAGQTCLAPDYVLLPERSRDAFVEAAQRIVPARYPDPSEPSYTSIIDEKSYSRLRAALENARSRGASVVPLVPGADADDASRKLPPQLVLDVDDTMQIMQEEIPVDGLDVFARRRLNRPRRRCRENCLVAGRMVERRTLRSSRPRLSEFPRAWRRRRSTDVKTGSASTRTSNLRPKMQVQAHLPPAGSGEFSLTEGGRDRNNHTARHAEGASPRRRQPPLNGSTTSTPVPEKCALLRVTTVSP